MRRTPKALIDTVSDRTLRAWGAGFRLGALGASRDEAKLRVVDETSITLTVEEQMAYAQLLPATFWASFNRGYEAGHWSRMVTRGADPR